MFGRRTPRDSVLIDRRTNQLTRDASELDWGWKSESGGGRTDSPQIDSELRWRENELTPNRFGAVVEESRTLRDRKTAAPDDGAAKPRR
jgi:hypothetical protein